MGIWRDRRGVVFLSLWGRAPLFLDDSRPSLNQNLKKRSGEQMGPESMEHVEVEGLALCQKAARCEQVKEYSRKRPEAAWMGVGRSVGKGCGLGLSRDLIVKGVL